MLKDYNIYFPKDLIKPTINLLGGSSINTNVHSPFVDPGVLAMNNIEGNISSSVFVLGTVDTSQTGYNTLRYFVIDLYGNSSDTLTSSVFDGMLFLKPTSIQKENVSIVLYDLLGKLLLEKTIEGDNLQTISLDLENLPKEVYLLKVQLGNSIANKKIQLY